MKKHISHDECFMEIAKIVAKRSKDPKAQNGACIASSDNRILSAGYNGFPYVDQDEYGNNDDLYPWTRSEDFEEDKLSYVVHAEANALLNFRGISREMEGATIYVTQIPCNECAKLIIQAGIKRVVYLRGENKPRTNVTRKMFKYANVSLEKYKY